MLLKVNGGKKSVFYNIMAQFDITEAPYRIRNYQIEKFQFDNYLRNVNRGSNSHLVDGTVTEMGWFLSPVRVAITFIFEIVLILVF